MNARLMIWTGPGRTVFNIAIALLALALSARCGSRDSDSLTGADNDTGTIRVSVIGTGSASGFAITVRLTGLGNFPERTASTFLGGTSTFTELPPGTYTAATTIIGFTCQPVSANVQAG